MKSDCISVIFHNWKTGKPWGFQCIMAFGSCLLREFVLTRLTWTPISWGQGRDFMCTWAMFNGIWLECPHDSGSALFRYVPVILLIQKKNPVGRGFGAGWSKAQLPNIVPQHWPTDSLLLIRVVVMSLPLFHLGLFFFFFGLTHENSGAGSSSNLLKGLSNVCVFGESERNNPVNC